MSLKVFITSGGTKVPIDDVRHIGNMSSGRYGSEIADAFSMKNDDVIFFHDKGSRIPVKLQIACYNGAIDSWIHPFKDYFEYLDAPRLVQLHKPDIIISAAAVSDYITDKVEGKISSSEDELIIRLKKAQKVLPLLRQAAPDAMLVGFKLLVDPTDEQIHDACEKVLNSGADYVVYNDLSEIRKGNATRTVFNKRMEAVEVATAEELVTFLKDEHEKYYNR